MIMRAPPGRRPPTPKAAGQAWRVRSERIPGRPLRELKVVEIDPETPAQSGPDGHDDDALGADRGEAQASNEVRRPVQSSEASKNRSSVRQIIDQHHRPIAVG